MSSSLQLPVEANGSKVDLPVIDISELPQDLDAQHLTQLRDHPVIAKLRKACQEWGFFYLVNHGIPTELLDKTWNASRDLLSMPTEVKDKVTTCEPFDSYYRSHKFETFGLPDSNNSDSFGQMFLNIWPEGNLEFCETMATYRLCVSNLAQQVTKLIIVSLGLDAKAFYHSHFEKCIPRLRLNGYSSENKDIGEVTLGSHADVGCLTFLHHDNVGGLQIRSLEGEWLNVEPLSHSFVVNLGSSFQAWSNGEYRSAAHRVVCKGWRDRMSIALITVFPMETEIWAPEELVDANNPRRYKPSIFSEFKHDFITNKECKDKTAALEHFASI